MRRYLTFTLAAPMASFGHLAVGGRRTGAGRPTKSQVLGLLAAALGIERTQEAMHAALAAHLGYAVRVDDPGIAETDYHTAQVPPTTHRRRYATRAEELAVPKHELETELSWREFRSGVQATVCVWRTGPEEQSSDVDLGLEKLAAKLAQPEFTLFLGRKAHPLMLPCRPRIVEVATVAAAFTERDMASTLNADLTAFHARFGTGSPSRAGARARTVVVYADAIPEAELGLAIERGETARDVPESRAKWRFGVRPEIVARWSLTQ